MDSCVHGLWGYSLSLPFISRVSVDAELCAVMYLLSVHASNCFNLEVGVISR